MRGGLRPSLRVAEQLHRQEQLQVVHHSHVRDYASHFVLTRYSIVLDIHMGNV